MLRTARILACAAILATFALVVVSTGSGQIPTEIGTRVPSTAPSPAPATQPRRVDGWGELIDPGGDCALRQDGARVTLEVPAGSYDLWPEGKRVNAPRLVQPAQGDFTVQVKVVGGVMPEKGSEAAGRDVAFRAATLVIWQDADNFVRLDRAAMLKKGKPFSQTYYHINQSAKRTTHLNKPVPPDGDLWLRLQRKGDTIIAGSSADGTTWTDYPPQTATLADKLHVGVAVLNVSTAPSAAMFESLELQ